MDNPFAYSCLQQKKPLSSYFYESFRLNGREGHTPSGAGKVKPLFESVVADCSATVLARAMEYCYKTNAIFIKCLLPWQLAL